MNATGMPVGELKLSLIQWIAGWSPDFERRAGLLLQALSRPYPPRALTLGEAAEQLAQAQRAGGRAASRLGKRHARQRAKRGRAS